jgi:hypothetical protein
MESVRAIGDRGRMSPKPRVVSVAKLKYLICIARPRNRSCPCPLSRKRIRDSLIPRSRKRNPKPRRLISTRRSRHRFCSPKSGRDAAHPQEYQPRTSDNATPQNLETGFSGGGAGTIRCSCSTSQYSNRQRSGNASSSRFRSARTFGHEKSNYTGCMLARHMKPNNILFHTRLVPHETHAIQPPKRCPKIRKFCRESHHGLREINKNAISNLINESNTYAIR